MHSSQVPQGTHAAQEPQRLRNAATTVWAFLRWRRQLAGEAWRFGVVGGVNMVVNFAVFNLVALTVLTGGELKANIVAVVIATTSSYLMNRHWTFRHRPRSTMTREYPLFFLFNAAGLAIELAVMGLAKYGLGLTTLLALNLAKATGIGIGTIFRFWAYRTFVFAHRPGARVTTTPAPRARAEPVELGGLLRMEAELAAELAVDRAAGARAKP